MNRNEDGKRVFSAQLVRFRDTPVRLAFATLVGSFRFWAGLVVGLPTVSLLVALVYTPFAPLAAGIPVGICLWLQWLSHEFLRPDLIIDPADQTLTKSKPYGNGKYRPIDADIVNRVSIVQYDRVAIVRLHYAERVFSKPLATAVFTSDIPDIELQLERLGVDTSVRKLELASLLDEPTGTRVLGTPVAIVGSLIAVWTLFGSEAFLSNAVIVPAITMIVFGVTSAVSKRRTR